MQILTETQSNDSYSWDGHVNLTADGSSVYLYDVENRLVERRVQGAGNTNCMSLAYTGALEASLKYDPAGRLYEVSGGIAGIQRFAYDGNAMIGEYNASGAMLRRYVHGSNVGAALRQAQGDRPLIVYEGAAVADATRRYLHADPRGSIVAVTNWQGTAIATNSYDEFGIPDTASGTDIASKGRFRYTGQAWLPELGMYYYKARIYSPTLGRFLQTDPIGYEDQFNLYAYVGNDPVNGVDPTGLDGRTVCNPEAQCTTVPGDINEIILNIGLGKRAPPPPQSALLGVINQPGNGRPRARASSASPQNNITNDCSNPDQALDFLRTFIGGIQLGSDAFSLGAAATGVGLPAAGFARGVNAVAEGAMGVVNLYDAGVNGNWGPLIDQGAGVGARFIPGGTLASRGARALEGTVRNSAGQFARKFSVTHAGAIREAAQQATEKGAGAAVNGVRCGLSK